MDFIKENSILIIGLISIILISFFTHNFIFLVFNMNFETPFEIIDKFRIFIIHIILLISIILLHLRVNKNFNEFIESPPLRSMHV